MKLAFRQVDLQLTHTWTIARASVDVSPVVLVELTETGGLNGVGEASPISRYHESIDSVITFFRRVDVTRLSFQDVPASMAYLDSLSNGDQSAKCALNVALLDGAARQAGQPLHDFLGLPFRERQHLTSFSIGIAAPEIIRKKVAAATDYPVLKLKVGLSGDEANLAALREVAPTKLVRVDANEGWKTREEALARITWLARDGRIEFVEQPMPASTSIADLAWLKERSPLPLFADESFHLVQDVTRCAAIFHGVNVKLVKTGGVTGGLAALQAARQAGLKTMLGCMIETSVLISAAAHLAAWCDFLDLDGNLLITNDPYQGVKAERGLLSFAQAPEPYGLRVRLTPPGSGA